jgi:hypothetical protein
MAPAPSRSRSRALGLALAVLLPLASGCRQAGDRPQSGPVPFAAALARAGGSADTSLVVRPGTVVILDGTASGADRQAADLEYLWRQTGGPTVRIRRPRLPRTEVLLAAEGQYRFALVTSCSGRRSEPAPVRVTVTAQRRGLALGPTAGPLGPRPGGTRRAAFALLGSNAGELIRIFAAKTGITLRVAPEWMRPEELRDIPVTFMARKVSPAAALEMAARLIGAPYVRDSAEGAFLAPGLGWLNSEPSSARFYPTALITPPGRGEELLALVREACRGALFACRGASVEFDRRRDGLHVAGPASMHARIASLLAAIGSSASLPGRPALSANEGREQEVLRRRLRLILANRDFATAALELEQALGVPVAWSENLAGKRRAPQAVSCHSAGRPAREVLDELARKGGFKGWEWVSGGGIWFCREQPGRPGREHLWKSSVVRAYDLLPLKRRGVLPGAALHAVRSRVRPRSWRDPATLCARYRHTETLVVVTSPRIQREVLRALHDLLEEKPATGDP